MIVLLLEYRVAAAADIPSIIAFESLVSSYWRYYTINNTSVTVIKVLELFNGLFIISKSDLVIATSS